MLKVYSATWCGFCSKLKASLRDYNIPYVEVDIDSDLDEAFWLMKSGYKTLPQVFGEDGVHIGGCERTIEFIKGK